MGGTPLNTPDPRLLMQALLAQRMQGQAMSGVVPGSMTPVNQPSTQSQATPQSTGGIPGAASQPPANPVQPGAARQLSPASPAPFNGTFGDRKGVISQLVNSAEKKTHDKKVNEAAMYYNQINSFLASNTPEDQAKAQQLLDDPKVRKILKTGLDYVPLEEEVPPEAIGVHQAQQKINQKQSTLAKLQQMLTGGRQQGSAQPRPQGRAIIPQASQASQQAYQLGEAKTGEQQSLAKMHEAEALADKQKADAETAKAEADKVKALADITRSRAEAKWYEQQAQASKDKTPSEIEQYKMGAALKHAQADEAQARGKYYGRMPTNRLPGQVLEKNLKAAQDELNISFREAIAQNNKIQEAMQKQTGLSKKTGGYFGLGIDPSSGSFEASQKVKKFKEAMAWFVGEGTYAVKNGTMTVPDTVAEVSRRVGIDIPPPVMGGVDKSDDEVIPDRPSGVPEDAEWDPTTRTWTLEDTQ